MRIGILTFHKVINNGSLLQAYSMSQLFKKHFPKSEVEIIDYTPLKGMIKEFRSNFVTRRWSNFIAGFSKVRKMQKFHNENLNLSIQHLICNDYLRSSNFINKLKYDMIIVGSDVVFEIKDKSAYTPLIPNIYWLGKNVVPIKIAFAVSADKSNVTPNNKQKKFLQESLLDFDLLGVRDNFTISLLNKILGNNNLTEFLPDPTFSMEIPKTNIEVIFKNLKIDKKKPILGLHIANKKLSQKLSDYYRNKGYQIVAPLSNKYADIELNGKLSPFDWANIYKYFTLTITNRFHGTIFCIKNKVNFVSIDDSNIYKNQESKKESLLRDCDLLEHFIEHDKSTDFEYIINKISHIEFNQKKFEIAEKKQKMKIFSFMEKIERLVL